MTGWAWVGLGYGLTLATWAWLVWLSRARDTGSEDA